jgi:predicted RecA/RadA family phage recombinase
MMTEQTKEQTVVELFGSMEAFEEAWGDAQEVFRKGQIGVYILPKKNASEALRGVPNYFVYNWKTHKIEGAYMQLLQAIQIASVTSGVLEALDEPVAVQETELQ